MEVLREARTAVQKHHELEVSILVLMEVLREAGSETKSTSDSTGFQSLF